MTCTPEQNEENAQRAKIERPGVKFAPFQVTIRSVDENKIVFSTRGEDDAVHDFSMAPSEVWLDCPSTARQAGDRGDLYLSEAAAKATSLGDGKTRIKGTTGGPGGQPAIQFKWPESGGTVTLATLPIWPTKIVIEGHAHGDPALEGSISLLDLGKCGGSQVITLDSGGMITLSLTKEGFAEFSLAMPDRASKL